MSKDIKVDKTLDIKGLSEPRPGQITRDTLDKMAEGHILRVITDDRNTKQTIPMLCKQLGYTLLSVMEDRGTVHFIVRK